MERTVRKDKWESTHIKNSDLRVCTWNEGSNGHNMWVCLTWPTRLWWRRRSRLRRTVVWSLWCPPTGQETSLLWETNIILYTSHYTFLLSSLFDNRLLFFSTSLIHRSCSSSFLRYSHLWCCKADEDRGQRLLCDHWDDLLQIWVGRGSSSWWVYGTFFSWAPRWRWDWMWPCSRGRPSPGRLVRAGPEHQPRTTKRRRVNDCHDCWRL